MTSTRNESHISSRESEKIGKLKNENRKLQEDILEMISGRGLSSLAERMRKDQRSSEIQNTEIALKSKNQKMTEKKTKGYVVKARPKH